MSKQRPPQKPATDAEFTVADEPLPGERLRKARESQELTREHVAQQLRLNVAIVEALEQSDIGAVGAPVFVTGYLRVYARFLHLPEDAIISAYEPLLNALQAPSTGFSASASSTDFGRINRKPSRRLGRKKAKSGLSRGLSIIILAALLGAAGYYWYSQNKPSAVTAIDMAIPDVP